MPVRNTARIILLVGAASAGLAAGCAAEMAADPVDARANRAPQIQVTTDALSTALSRPRCQAQTRVRPPGETVPKAERIPAGSATPEGAAAPLQEHSLARGQTAPNTGIKNNPYAIGFELPLPSAGKK